MTPMQRIYKTYYNFCLDNVWDYNKIVLLLKERGIEPVNIPKRISYWEKQAAKTARKLKNKEGI